MALKYSTLGLVGATFGAAALLSSHAQASPASPEELNHAMQAQSYADLLTPIGNASALLQTAAMTDSAGQANAGDASIQLAQYHHHHHHHHHHHFYHHHHHHHHHFWHHHWHHHWHHDY